VSLTARQRELAARHLLAHPDQIALCLKQRKWEELAAVAEFAAEDVPRSLAHTDPALYRLLRQQITDFCLRGWCCLSPRKLQHLARTAKLKEPDGPLANKERRDRKPR